MVTQQPGDPGQHYFSATPSSPSSPRTVELVLPEGALLTLRTDRGTFSPDRVDAGTRVLLAEGPAVPRSGAVADIGCGYGPIALALALRGGPALTVWAVDVNERARDLCRANAQEAGLADQIHVAAPDEVPPEVTFDQIWSNPPIRIGKGELHDLLRRWLDRLRPDSGIAALVVNKNLGADSLARWLEGQGWPTSRLASRAGYRVLQAEARPMEGSP